MSPTWYGWPEEPAEGFAGLPPCASGGEEGEARVFRARATGGREREAVAAVGRTVDPRAAHTASEVGKEERRKTEGRRGGPGFGTGSASFPGSEGIEMARDEKRVIVWRAVLMLLVALGIFAGACWLLEAQTDGAADWTHACAGRCL